ncbi:ABC transporter ATP-binding protein [Candidatus Dojkabacteria bacterium]|uniref:ABC transporter ATP-binding protein n=1 Tax=Candidatus Dojkabacteria bacterium TaxID=2099670 RepID=A0A847VCZ4_9BACT|nr:ABC transporter ATP-binding protein [Candidatus Dojkabacteria bacterium]
MGNSNMITIENLNVLFEGNGKDLHVLRDMSFSVKKGSFVSIIGPSGCGKSTLFRIISGLPTRDTCKITGKIRIDNRKPETASKNRDIGLIFQKPTLLEWRNVTENISLPLEIMGYEQKNRKEDIKKLLAVVDLTPYSNYRPSELSGGMQQKVSIGRALAYNPELLLMDEPFGSLDEINRRKMNNEIVKIWTKLKKTILFVTHSIQEAVFLSQKVIILTKKPSTIHKTIEIDLPYPRNTYEGSSKYFNYIKEIRGYLNDACN